MFRKYTVLCTYTHTTPCGSQLVAVASPASVGSHKQPVSSSTQAPLAPFGSTKCCSSKSAHPFHPYSTLQRSPFVAYYPSQLQTSLASSWISCSDGSIAPPMPNMPPVLQRYIFGRLLVDVCLDNSQRSSRPYAG